MALKVSDTSSGPGFIPEKEPPDQWGATAPVIPAALVTDFALDELEATLQKQPLAPSTCLERAAALTSGDRQRDYGHPSQNFNMIAGLWSVALGIEVTPRMVGRLMVLMKMARDIHTPKEDNLDDTAGYARTMEMLDEAA